MIPNPGVPPKRPMPAKVDPRQVQKLAEMANNLMAQIEEIQTQHRFFYKSPVYPNCLQANINGVIDRNFNARNEKLNEKVLEPLASAGVHVRPGDQVFIRVFDSEQRHQSTAETFIKAAFIIPLIVDIFENKPSDELIGVTKLTVTSEMIKQGRVELSFGLVKSLVVEIKPKQP